MSSLYDDLRGAKNELRDYIFGADHPTRTETYDYVGELAEQNTPIYYGDVADYLGENINLALTPPELGMGAYETPMAALLDNIYHHFYNELAAEVDDLIDERNEQEAGEDDENEDEDESQEDAVLDIADDGAYDA